MSANCFKCLGMKEKIQLRVEREREGEREREREKRRRDEMRRDERK